MNKIEKLIKEFCSDGVEWKKLGEVAKITGAGVDKKKKSQEKSIKLLNYMDIYKNQYINLTIPAMIVTASENKIQNCNIEYGDIFITPSSETIEDIFRSAVATENMPDVVYSYHIMRIRLNKKNFVTSCYLNYVFDSEVFRMKLFKHVNGNTRKTIAKSEIEKLSIPIPSIETQEKIVKILDNFTKYITELQAELQARNKQYNYYRDMLLSEDYLNKISEKLKNQTKYEIYCIELEEIIKIKNGKDWKSLGKGNVPVYGSGGEMGIFVDKYSYNKPTVLIPRKGSIENIFYLEEPFWNVDTIFYTEINEEKVLPKYFYYFMQNYNIAALSTNPTRPSITQSTLNKLKISLPSIEIQNKIVKILDRFQELLSDTKGLLPLEIEQRRKQYEYYREKLLTFDSICARTNENY